VPERVVHARGAAAFGYFEAYGTVGDEPVARYSRAKLFQDNGKRTDVALRFSTVAGGRDSSELAWDPRGFAVMTPNAGLIAITELVDRVGVTTALDAGIGPVKRRDRGMPGGELLVSLDRLRADTAGQARHDERRSATQWPKRPTSAACVRANPTQRRRPGVWFGRPVRSRPDQP
jgi:hypothetical protein